MNTQALNSLADLICRAQEQDRTPMGIAFKIDAAGRHMSPEVAAELESLRARVAELEAAAEQIRFLHKDSPMGPCPVCVDADAMARGGDGTLPYPCATARLAGAKDCDPPSRVAAATQAVRDLVVDGEHYAVVHHSYTTGRDLPPLGGAR